jgi:membrane protease subunit HflK
VGAASRLKEESQAYRERIVAQAEGDAQRFKAILPEYQNAPQVTRDRMYVDAMQQIYSNVTKVVIDSKQGSNLMYLPLDKLIQMTGSPANNSAVSSDAATACPYRRCRTARQLIPGRATHSAHVTVIFVKETAK